MNVSLGIDIGGTNIQWGVVSAEGKVLEQGNLNTRDFATATQMVDAVVHTTDFLWSKYTLRGIGVGAPNGNYFNGTIEYAPNLTWKGVIPLAAMFEEEFEGVPVWVTNDANAAAIGEMQFGVAQGVKDFIIVTLGTGLGSGFVVNGQLAYGHDGFAGELGHTTIEIDGRQCGCGRKGCLETYVSATGIVRTAKQFLEHSSSYTVLKNNDTLSSKMIAFAAQNGDKLALEIFDYTAKKLGFALANAVAITSPAMIVLYGGLANAGAILFEPTQKYMEEYMLNIFKGKVAIKASTIPQNQAAILGAAALAWNNLETVSASSV